MAGNADEALGSLRNAHPDVAVIDVMMPGRDGVWLASALRQEHPTTAVVLATAHTDLLNGAPRDPLIADYLVKPFQRDRFELAVERARGWRRKSLAESEWQTRLSQELRDRIDAVRTHLLLQRALGADESVVLQRLAGARTPDVAAHAERVARYAVVLARELKLDEATIPAIESAARFHDIGMIVMPEALLTKPSKMEESEVAVIRRHPAAGAEILESTTSLRELAPMVGACHEWFSGGGYPGKVASTAIPLASRLISVAEAYDCMTQSRGYRTRVDAGEAVRELLRCAPSQFDPDVVVAFLTVLGRH
jgi:putative two-component system response regulator